MLDNLFTPSHIVILVFLSIIFAIYFLPTFIAVHRRHHNRFPIILINILIGWTVIGWIVALIWSAMSTTPTTVTVIQQPPAS